MDDCTRDLRRGEDDIPAIPALPLGDNMKDFFHDWLYDELKYEIEWDTIVKILDRYSQTLIEDYERKPKRSRCDYGMNSWNSNFYRHLHKLAKLIWELSPVVSRDIFRIVGRNN